MDISSSGGIGNLVKQGLDNLQTRTASLQEKMAEVANMNSEDQTAAMLEMQFEIGQYNTMVELTSNCTKTLSDALKSVSQKI